MDAGLDIAVAMDNAANVAMNEALNSEWDNAKNAGHVEVCDPMAEEAVEAFLRYLRTDVANLGTIRV